MESSDSEVETTGVMPRLGLCEVCDKNNAIYTCPRCEVKTCCLNCIRIHKKELECDGVRDRTKYIRIKDFTDVDLLSDYRLLEECARFVYGVKRDEKKKFTRIDKNLPVHLFKLKTAAVKRGIVLHFLAQNFTRHLMNTTRYNYKTQIIHWKVDWVFPNAEPDAVKFSDVKCNEGSKLSQLLDKYISVNDNSFEGAKTLTYYKAAGFSGIRILLRAEKVRGSTRKFFELDPSETLNENLSGKCIIEYPIIFVVLKDHAYNFEIITPDDEFDYKKESKETCNQESETMKTENVVENNDNVRHKDRKRQKELLTEKIAKQKNLEIEREIKEEKRRKPKNLLFTTGYSSDESLHHSDES